MSRRRAPAARPAPPWIDPDAGCRWTIAAPGADGPAADDDPADDGLGLEGQGWPGGRLDDYEGEDGHEL